MCRLIALLFVACGFAQGQSATFEVVTIKPNNAGGGPYAQFPPGRLTMTYYSVRELIAFAYGLRPEQVVGDAFPDRYDIEATADPAMPVSQMSGPLLQKLLEDRFQLKVHRETRQLPVYELTVAKGGIKMAPARPSRCTPVVPDARPAPTTTPRTWCNIPYTGARGLIRTLDGTSIDLDAIAVGMSRSELNRTVVNKTGLAGIFDVNLKWAVDPTIPGLDDGKGGARVESTSTEPTIFVAVEEQLGLKLEAARAPMEVIVIDRVEKPSQN